MTDDSILDSCIYAHSPKCQRWIIESYARRDSALLGALNDRARLTRGSQDACPGESRNGCAFEREREREREERRDALGDTYRCG